ncbi:MAG: ABC transporter permease [Saprospiraceae bacterium]|nr:MAG: ABC transporter permease [Saprospiraceae bacterium]
MWKNYLKIAFRNLFKEKLNSFINLFNLSVAITVVLLIFLFVKDEWSFDHFHSKSDRIYRNWVKEHYQGEVFFNTVTPFILGEELKENLPEVESVVQYLTQTNVVRKGTFKDQETIHLATPSLLEVFDFSLLKGEPDQVLDSPNKVVLSPEIAQKYFGDADPTGESLDLQLGGEWRQFQVSGIIKPAPQHSSIQYDMLIAFENVKQLFRPGALVSWTTVYPETYVLLRPGTDLASLSAKTASLIDSKVTESYAPGEYIVGYQPLTDIHLNNEIPVGIVAVSDWRYPYILGAIGLLILLLAGINYVSLSVGQSLTRAREVGVRKVNGANRMQLMVQFWSETIFLTVLAVFIGFMLTNVVLPYFNQLAGKSLVLEIDFSIFLFIVLLTIVLGLAAGLYPALVLSGFSPLKTLYGKVNKLGTSKHFLLRTLVGFQFVLSVGLIICTYIMQEQMQYLQNKNLGFDKDQLISIPYLATPTAEKGLISLYKEGYKKGQLLQNELADEREVLGFAISSHTFGTPGWVQVGYTDEAIDKYRGFYLLATDYNFLPVMEVGMKQGRHFSEETATDIQGGVIVNETMAKTFGWEDYLDTPLPPPFEGFRLIGITEDFNFSSLREEVQPLLMTLDPLAIIGLMSDMNYGDLPLPKYTLKLEGGNIPYTLGKIEQAWRKLAPDQPFQFSFIDEAINAQYRSEQSLSSILSFATLLAIVIAALGLFGIASITAARRTKEIGIRKVLGASVLDIVLMLNRHLTGLVVVATLIAAPLSWLIMRSWLKDFAFQVGINPITFVIAGLLALAIAWVAVSFQAFRAGMASPVDSLRSE